MASFAKIGLNSKVIKVVSVHNNELLDAMELNKKILELIFKSTTGWAFGNKRLTILMLENIN